MRYDYDGEDDVPIDSTVFQVHATVDAANENADNYFDMLLTEYNFHSSMKANEDIIRDDKTFFQSIQPQPTGKWYEVEVLKKDLFGGTINPTKKPAAKKAPATKPKKVVQEASDEDDELDAEGEDDDVDNNVIGYTTVNASNSNKSVTTVSIKRRKSDSADNDDDPFVTPSGFANSLGNRSFAISGTLDGWTHPQVESLIKFYGGTVKPSLTHDPDYVVLGAHIGSTQKTEIKAKGLTTMNQNQLWGMIEQSEGEGDVMLDGSAMDSTLRPPQPKKRSKKA